MNETATNDGSGGTGGQTVTIDDLIDLATDRHIEGHPGKYEQEALTDSSDQVGKVYTEPNEPWEWMVENEGYGSVADAKSADTVKVNGDDTISVEVTGGLVVFFLKGGQAYNEIRSMFEEVKPTFERVDTYPLAGFSTETDDLAKARKMLKPVENLEDRAEELLSLDVGNSSADEDKDTLASIFGDATSEWDNVQKVSSNLAKWEGRAAEVFKGTYIDRFPSILTGQMLVAVVLEDSLHIVGDAFINVWNKSYAALYEAYNLLEGFPDVVEGEAAATDWKTLLTYVSGAATVVAGAAAPIPVGGTAVAAVATVAAGGASIGATIVESPTHKDLEGKPAYIKGGSVVKIMDNFHKRIKRFLDTVENSEQELAKWLKGFNDVVIDKAASGVTVYTTWGDDVELSQWQSYFAIKAPAIGKISDGTGHGSIESKDSMGTAPDKGEQFAGELEQLLKTGHKYLPELADNYKAVAVTKYSDGLDFAFTREGEKSPVYAPWVELFDLFDTMIDDSETHMRDAATGLIAAAESYAAQDDAAAAKLREDSDYFDE